MAIYYNAFISYRHHPTDIRVATQLQRALERFHIPKAVRRNQNGALRLAREQLGGYALSAEMQAYYGIG